jgi:hypothetical protein
VEGVEHADILTAQWFTTRDARYLMQHVRYVCRCLAYMSHCPYFSTVIPFSTQCMTKHYRVCACLCLMCCTLWCGTGVEVYSFGSCWSQQASAFSFGFACRHIALSALLRGLNLPSSSYCSAQAPQVATSLHGAPAAQSVAAQATAVLSPAQVQAVVAEVERHARARFRWVLCTQQYNKQFVGQYVHVVDQCRVETMCSK